jgi:flagellar motor switch protein FliN/FliY
MSDVSEAPNMHRPQTATYPIDLLAGIHVRISVEVGSTSMTLSQLATLEKGSIIALDRKVGEPLDICANGSLVARGEIVAAEGHYGVRVTEIIAATPAGTQSPRVG